MRKQIISEEFRRMQVLAGLITESKLNEGLIDLSDAAAKLLMDKSKYMLKPGTDTGVYVVYDLSLPKGKGSFGDDDDTQKVGVLWTKDSTYKSNKFESDHNDTIKKLMALKESYLNEAEEIKVGGIYIYNWKEGKSPIKVKILAQDKEEPNYYTVESLEDNQDGIKKGNHYRAEVKNLTSTQQAESLNIESIVNEVLAKARRK